MKTGQPRATHRHTPCVGAARAAGDPRDLGRAEEPHSPRIPEPEVRSATSQK